MIPYDTILYAHLAMHMYYNIWIMYVSSTAVILFVLLVAIFQRSNNSYPIPTGNSHAQPGLCSACKWHKPSRLQGACGSECYSFACFLVTHVDPAFPVPRAVGGVMGFAKKGSSKSLGGGLSAALVLVLAARSMSAGAASAAGAQVAFGESRIAFDKSRVACHPPPSVGKNSED